MPAPSDLVHQTTLGTGTGTLTLVAVNGKRSFNTAFGTGGSNVFDYFISNRDAAEWERGTGHLSDATTLVRDSVLASSNSGSAVNFSAGTKDITNDVPAGKQYYQGGPTLAVADGGTGDSGTGWSTWSPTVSAQFGTITSATVNSARYKQIGKTTFIQLDITINTNGTGSGHVFATLPANGVSGKQQVMTMLETANTGKFGGGFIGIGADYTKVSMGFYDGTYPGADTNRLVCCGSYEAA